MRFTENMAEQENTLQKLIGKGFFCRNYMFLFLFIQLAILFFPLGFGLTAAQVFENPDSLRPFDLTGMTEGELLQAIGEPDSRDTSRRAHQWRYENAVVFLSEGRVVAWTNSDILERRKHAWEVQRSISRPVEEAEETSMSWKPDRAATPRAVLDELIGTENIAEPERESRSEPAPPVTGTKQMIQSLFGGGR